MMRIHPLMSVPLVFILVGGCERENPIKKIECQYSGDKGKSAYHFDGKTGKSYEKDEFSDKFTPLDGRTSDNKINFDTRSFIVGDEWRQEMAISNKPEARELVLTTGFMLRTTINLKTLEVSQKSYKEGYTGQWEYSQTYSGKCKWVKEKSK